MGWVAGARWTTREDAAVISKMGSSKVVGLGLLALALAACGKTPTASRMSVRDNAPQAPVAQPTPGALPPGAVPGAAPVGEAKDGLAVAQAARAAFLALPGYQVKLSYWMKLGNASGTGLTAVTGRPPAAMRVEVVKGNNAGTKLRYDGGSKVKVRPTGLFGGITVDLPLSDERVLNTRGDTLDAFSINGMLQRFTDPANRVSLLPDVAGGKAVRIEGPRLLKGCTSMIAVVDPTTLFPRQVTMYEGEEVVGRLTLADFGVLPNPKLDI